MRSIFIVVPSLRPAAPVKGAIALANALCGKRKVTLFAAKPGPGAEAPIDPKIVIDAPEAGDRLWRRLSALRIELAASGGRSGAAIISFCLSADGLALLSRRSARVVCSVRGNLPRNYRIEFGPIGRVLAAAHLTALRGADTAVAMSEVMADQIARYVGRRPAVIGNFIDEEPLVPFRRPAEGVGRPWRFAFAGRLTPLKRPMLLLDSVERMTARGHEVRLDIVGDGPLRDKLAAAIELRGLKGRVYLHGWLSTPYAVMAAADAFVLPSLTEGLSRAALEALHLGVPIVLRDVDGSRELVRTGVNGSLFADDREMDEAMIQAAQLRRSADSVVGLLPSGFRQADCAEKYLVLAEDAA